MILLLWIVTFQHGKARQFSLPNMRPFTVLFPFLRLTGDLSIQMVTALVLQLIQCSVKIPEKTDDMQDVAEDDENKPRVSCANIA